jgi:hypothetical protein
MLKWALNTASVAAFACIVLGFAFVEWRTSSQGQSANRQSTEKSSYENAKTEPNEGVWHWLTHDAAGFFTLWLVIVGGFQLGFFYWQLRLIRESLDDAKIAADAARDSAAATRASVELADRTTKHQLRAYVGVKESEIRSGDGGNTFAVHIVIINSGETPARQVTHRIAAELQILHGPPLSFELPERAPGEWVMVPDIAFTLKRDIAIGGASGTGTIRTGERTIFTWGRVDYVDIFGKPQHFEFRYRSGRTVFARVGDITRPVGWEMDPEDQGNTAT